MSAPESGPGTGGRQPADDPAQQAAQPRAVARKRPTTGKPLPSFRVLLHNDDINEVRYVVRTIIELTRMDSGRAMQVSMTAHKEGVALVLLTHKERAELYREQFASRRLKVSIEPAQP